jgi:hypothetical protein
VIAKEMTPSPSGIQARATGTSLSLLPSQPMTSQVVSMSPTHRRNPRRTTRIIKPTTRDLIPGSHKPKPPPDVLFPTMVDEGRVSFYRYRSDDGICRLVRSRLLRRARSPPSSGMAHEKRCQRVVYHMWFFPPSGLLFADEPNISMTNTETPCPARDGRYGPEEHVHK